MSFQEELTHLINTHSMENRSGTPDFILAEYMFSCLHAYEKAKVDTDRWHKEAPLSEPRVEGQRVIQMSEELRDEAIKHFKKLINELEAAPIIDLTKEPK